MQHYFRLMHTHPTHTLYFASVRVNRCSLLNSSCKSCIVITTNNPAATPDFVPAALCSLLGGDLDKLTRAWLPLEVVFLRKVSWVDDGLDGGVDVGCVGFTSDYVSDLLTFAGLNTGMNYCWRVLVR